MKIKHFELFKVPPRWLFLRLETDNGLVGWGEPIVEGRAETVRAAVTEMMSYLIGKDPLRIEDHWQVLYRGGFYRGGPVLMSALAGIDQALWDIKGKYYNAPVYDLLGGAVRDRIRIYSWVGGDRPGGLEDAVREQLKTGVTAVKMNATEELEPIDSLDKVKAVVERVATVRAVGGDKLQIAIDFHGRVSKTMAVRIAKEIEPFYPMFIEEPVLPEHNDALLEVRRATTIPIATGERMFSRWDFKGVLAAQTVDVVQPDLSHAGGITEVRKIAAMAEAYDVTIAPHCPLGPVSLAAALQVDACTHNFLIQEQSLGIHYNRGSDLFDYLKDPSVFRVDAEGYVALPTGPGLGIEIDEHKVRAAVDDDFNWRNPVWRHADGSVAEW